MWWVCYECDAVCDILVGTEDGVTIREIAGDEYEMVCRKHGELFLGDGEFMRRNPNMGVFDAASVRMQG